MNSKVTLKELAKILDVSVSTVSKALNDSPEISKQTRMKVRELADLNHYVPNILAQNLKNRHTKTIGVIIPDILPNFFAEAIYGIESQASERGYRVIICISNESIQKEEDSIKTLINGQVDGLIMSLSKETQSRMSIEHLKSIFHNNIPLLLFDRVLPQIKCDKIVINDALQAEQAVETLYESGCRNIAYFSHIANTSVDDQRREGYSTAIAKLGLGIHQVNFNSKEFPDQKLQFLVRKSKIDGVIASDELGAILVMKSALKAGIKIPDELSVIGFNNGQMSEHFTPTLSAVDQHPQEQGKVALDTIVDRIEGKLSEEFIEFKLETSIIKRESIRTSIPSIKD